MVLQVLEGLAQLMGRLAGLSPHGAALARAVFPQGDLLHPALSTQVRGVRMSLMTQAGCLVRSKSHWGLWARPCSRKHSHTRTPS